MRKEAGIILSRRKFLKIAAGGVLGGATLLGGGSFIHDRIVALDLERRTAVRPLLKKTPLAPRSVVFGGYFDSMRKSTEERVSPLTAVSTIFADWTKNDWWSEECRKLNKRKQVPMLTVGVQPTIPGEKITLDDFEGQLKRVSSVIEKLKGTYGIWRFNHESNGYFYPHSNKYLSDELIITMYQKMAAIFKKETPDWKLVYAPNVFYTEEMDRLYPGDDVVDLWGFSAFRKYSSKLSSFRRWEHPPYTAHQLLAPDVLHVQTKYPSKPLIICETAADVNSEGSDTFYRELIAEVPTWKNITGICLYSIDNRKAGDQYEADWNVFDKPIGDEILGNLKGNPVYYKGNLDPSGVLEKITASAN